MHGGIKRLKHPALGSVELDSSALSVDGRPGPGMIVSTPVDCAMAGRIGRLVASA
ncbi:hypothetical protein [Caballeronia concitans]|uniref:hypothetical protein n=1 Tax=Caballeronia concitans TaxID=1777133 RepID=UPI001AD82CB4|nr:hypothetical protein [Caballeronia concitans]